MSSHSAPSTQRKRGVDCFSDRSCADKRDSTDRVLSLLDNAKNSRTSLPTRDDLCFGEVGLGEPLVGQETAALSFAPLLPSGTVVNPLQNTSTHLSSTPAPVSESSGRESDVPIDESSAVLLENEPSFLLCLELCPIMWIR